MRVLILKKSRFVLYCRKDARFLALQRLTTQGAFVAVNLSNLVKELRQIHAVKEMRLFTAQKMLDNFRFSAIDLLMRVQGHKSRTVEIKMDIFRAKALLDEHLDKITKHFSTEYREQLHAEFRTAQERKDAIRYVLENYYVMTNRLNSAIVIADLVIEDLQSNYWTLRSTIDAVKTSIDREV